MSLSSNLFRLQQIDSQLDQGSLRLQAIEIALDDRSRLDEAVKQSQDAHDSLQKQRTALRQAENRVQDQKIKIQQTEAALYGGKVRNPKELQDLENEVAALKRHMATLEDRELEVMIAVEEAEAACQQVDKHKAGILSEVETLSAGLRAERDHLVLTQERLKVERLAAENAVPPADLEVYLHLRKVRNGVAVAKISDRTCSACGAGLTPALNQAANVPNQLVRCQSCGRILYPG